LGWVVGVLCCLGGKTSEREKKRGRGAKERRKVLHFLITKKTKNRWRKGPEKRKIAEESNFIVTEMTTGLTSRATVRPNLTLKACLLKPHFLRTKRFRGEGK